MLSVQSAVSVKRINKYLNSEEIDEDSVTHEKDSESNWQM